MKPVTFPLGSIETIMSMRCNGLANYIVPGLDSYMIGDSDIFGRVRLFQCSRDHREQITPHSHRFDFTAIVLQGSVKNLIWTESQNGDPFCVTQLEYSGKPGQYHETDNTTYKKMRITNQQTYCQGEVYNMTSEQIHSIEFSRDAIVLFFEGPVVANTSVILEPFVNGERIRTFKTEPWMFKSANSSST